MYGQVYYMRFDIYRISAFSFTVKIVLVQPRKTRPCLTERLLMGRKESNKTNGKNKCDFTPSLATDFCVTVHLQHLS